MSSAQPWEFRPTEIASQIRVGVLDMLTSILGEPPGFGLAISLEPPTDTDTRLRQARTSSLGTVNFHSNHGPPLSLPIPWPHDGVFLLRSDRSWQIERWIWHPRLVERPGIHFLTNAVRQGLRGVVVADRRHQVSCVVRSKRARTRRSGSLQVKSAHKRHRPPTPVYLPLLTRALLQSAGCSQNVAAIVDWNHVQHDFEEWCGEHLVAPDLIADAQDVRRQRLLTYNAYVCEAVLGTCARLFWRIPEAQAVLVGAPPDERAAATIWNAFVQEGARARWIQLQTLVDGGLLARFDPLNGVDAVSRLSALQRYDAAPPQIERMPAWRRQNHPSFEGLICPVESPETKKVGITLHLARGCRVSVAGELLGIETDKSMAGNGFGYAASMVPFAQHNDGVRCMMGAKNLKQAVPVIASQAPALSTGSETYLRDHVLGPLLDKGLVSPDEASTSPGTDLLVAYLPWYGWNADDAVVANERLREALGWEYVKDYEKLLLPDVRPSRPPAEGLWASEFRDGLRKPGIVAPDDAIAWLRDSTGFVHRVRSAADTEARLERVDFAAPTRDGFGGCLSWTLRHRLPLDVGDKVMGRHGNKGVVSVLLPEHRLPSLSPHDALPDSVRGRAIDLILNPNGVVSRMNMGQLIETHLGLLRFLRPELDLSGFAGPFEFDAEKQRWLMSQFREIEDSTGGAVDRFGSATLILPPRKPGCPPMAVKAIVGFQYFVRLKHIPSLKAQARRGGSGYPYSLTTGQPVAGRRRNGGQRVGEMEMWALDAHQATENLGDVLGARSDPTTDIDSFGKHRSPTFNAMRDHLRAIGVVLEPGNDTIGLRWLRGADFETGTEISSSATWQVATDATYACNRCDYQIQGIVGTRAAQRSDRRQPSVGDAIRGRLFQDGLGAVVPELASRSETAITIAFTLADQRAEVVFEIIKSKRSLSVRFSVDDVEYAAYQQIDGGLDPDDLALIVSMRLSCPVHATAFLETRQSTPVLRPEPGGVCDPDLVGGTDLNGSAKVQPGFVRLPFAMPHPLNRALPDGAASLPELECLAVLPVRYRHAMAARNLAQRRPAVDPLTKLYSDLVDRCRAYRTDAGEARGIRRTVDAIHRQIVGGIGRSMGSRRDGSGLSEGRLFGKLGLLRHDGLGRRVDSSGRLVIVPDPTLALDECRLPHLFLLELLLNELVLDPEQRRRIDGALKDLAGTRDESIAPGSVSPDSWRAALADRPTVLSRLVELTRGALELHLQRDRGFRVALNRQPTLHRYNLMSFRPVIADLGSDAPVLRESRDRAGGGVPMPRE